MSNEEQIYYGEVSWFARGYGFLRWEIEGVLQKDMFVHFSDIVCEGFKTLYKGRKVSFCIGTNRNGDPKAVNVTVLRN